MVIEDTTYPVMDSPIHGKHNGTSCVPSSQRTKRLKIFTIFFFNYANIYQLQSMAYTENLGLAPLCRVFVEIQPDKMSTPERSICTGKYNTDA